MNRHLCFAAIAVLLLAACDENKEKGKSTKASPAPAASAAVRAPDPLSFGTGATVASDAASAPTDESAADAGRRYFDGAALIKAGFVAPDGRGAVYAGPGTGNRARAVELTRGAKTRRRALDGSSVPAPDPDQNAIPPSPEALAAGAGKALAAFDGFQRRVFPDALVDVMSRAGWGARKRKGTATPMTPTHVTVHHTQGKQTMSAEETAAAVRGIQRYHMVGRAAEGKDVWDDIGYHFLIDGEGRVIEGRPAETLGAHARGANQDNIGVSMMGDFNRVRPTDAQVRSLTRLVSFLAVRYRQDPSRAGFLEPHRHYDQTDCPGANMMSILADLRLRIDAETQTIQAKIDAAPAGEFVPVTTDA